MEKAIQILLALLLVGIMAFMLEIRIRIGDLQPASSPTVAESDAGPFHECASVAQRITPRDAEVELRVAIFDACCERYEKVYGGWKCSHNEAYLSICESDLKKCKTELEQCVEMMALRKLELEKCEKQLDTVCEGHDEDVDWMVDDVCKKRELCKEEDD